MPLLEAKSLSVLNREHAGKVAELRQLVVRKAGRAVAEKEDDLFYLRYVLSNSKDLVAASSNATRAIQWRSKFTRNEVLEERFRSKLGFDFVGELGNGFPLVLVRPSVESIRKSNSNEVFEYLLGEREKLFQKLSSLSRKTGKLIKCVMVYDAKGLSSSDLNALRKMQKKHRSAFKEKFPQTTADSIIVNAKKVNTLAKTTLNALKGKTRFMDLPKFFNEFEVARSLQMHLYASTDEKPARSQSNDCGNVDIVNLSDSESEPESEVESETNIEEEIEIELEQESMQTELESKISESDLESESKSGSESGSILEGEQEKGEHLQMHIQEPKKKNRNKKGSSSGNQQGHEHDQTQEQEQVPEPEQDAGKVQAISQETYSKTKREQGETIDSNCIHDIAQLTPISEKVQLAVQESDLKNEQADSRQGIGKPKPIPVCAKFRPQELEPGKGKEKEQVQSMVTSRIQAIERKILKKKQVLGSIHRSGEKSTNPVPDAVQNNKAEEESKSLRLPDSDLIGTSNVSEKDSQSSNTFSTIGPKHKVRSVYQGRLRETPEKFGGVRTFTSEPLVETHTDLIPELSIERKQVPTSFAAAGTTEPRIIEYDSSDDEETEVVVIKNKDKRRVSLNVPNSVKMEPEIEIIGVKQQTQTRFSNVKRSGCLVGSDSEEEVEIVKISQHIVNHRGSFIPISSDEDDEVELVELKEKKQAIVSQIPLSEDEDEEVVIVRVATTGTRKQKRVTFKDIEEKRHWKETDSSVSHPSNTIITDNAKKKNRKYGAVTKYLRKTKAKKMLLNAIKQNEIGLLNDAISFTQNEALDNLLPQLVKKASDAVIAIEETHRKQLELENMYKQGRRKKKKASNAIRYATS